MYDVMNNKKVQVVLNFKNTLVENMYILNSEKDLKRDKNILRYGGVKSANAYSYIEPYCLNLIETLQKAALLELCDVKVLSGQNNLIRAGIALKSEKDSSFRDLDFSDFSISPVDHNYQNQYRFRLNDPYDHTFLLMSDHSRMNLSKESDFDYGLNIINRVSGRKVYLYSPQNDDKPILTEEIIDTFLQDFYKSLE